MRKPFRTLLTALLLAPLAAVHATDAPQANIIIIIILADDLGSGDVGCYGATRIKTQGYRSAAIGKWHLGYGKDWNRPPITGPLVAGFEYHFGVPQSHNDAYRLHRGSRHRGTQAGRAVPHRQGT